VARNRRHFRDKEEVAGAVGRIVKYAKVADDFDEHVSKLLPHVAALCGAARRSDGSVRSEGDLMRFAVARAPLALAVLALLLAGCGKSDHEAAPPAPLEISESGPAQFCGMALGEHAGPKGQIFLRDQAKPLWFASVRDAFAFLLLPEMPKDIAVIYVNDMARANNWR
jgi:NosL